MALNNIYNDILMEHNTHPDHKHKLSNASDCQTAINPQCESDAILVKKGINPSCGDEIVLEINVEDGIIKDVAFDGQGCAVSQASTDIMADLVIGKTIDEAIEFTDLFIKMVRGEETDEDKLEELDEALALKDIAHMPARVKCAVLAWHTLNQMLTDKQKN
ncbi:Fe-S cluster assembly sulfur transfer protein SufU [Pectinatus brassicae]|uniref:Nitrogen fixation NifU-like protein n=1 Tax=Pectinatus brassicae TaxID=862415 RepID=A0A840UHY5_9FIRM|nr:SUF system NifU family Fe-S cluster assembly protein [Pectinatus brassicae]MBB5335790.1 nitrogen fixation NifU-like protein [Pectinatus brassicae]